MEVVSAESAVKKQPGLNKKSWVIWIAAVFVIAFIAMTGLATYVGWNLTHPEKVVPENLPESLELRYESVKFKSADDLLLDGWLFTPQTPSNKLIIFSHGYANNRSHEVGALPTVKALLEAGYSCLMFDFRNSGLSEGELTSIGQFEKIDLLSAVSYGSSLGYKHIGVIGYSMGAVTAILAASETSDIQALVMDSPFAALEPYLRQNLSYWSHLPDFPFTPLVLWATPNLIGVDPDEVRPIDQIVKLRGRGLLFFHAKGDPSIPVENSQQLFEKLGNTYAELVMTDSNDHVGSYEVNPELYTKKVIELFDQYLR
jgi:pimeloyl-ACP methyl ester carboxylesterase